MQNVVKMQRIVKQRHGTAITVSVELEKKRQDMELLAEHADFIFVSKDYATHCGYNDMATAAKGVAEKFPNT